MSENYTNETNKIIREIAAEQARQSQHIQSLSDELREFKDVERARLMKHEKAIYGNGDKGLKEEVGLLKSLAENYRNQAAKTRAAVLGVGVPLIVGVFTILGKIVASYFFN